MGVSRRPNAVGGMQVACGRFSFGSLMEGMPATKRSLMVIDDGLIDASTYASSDTLVGCDAVVI